MLKVIIVGYGEMFTNLIAGTLDANCEIVGVLRGERKKYPSLIRKIKDVFNPSVEYNYIKSYSIPEIRVKSINSKEFKKAVLKLNPDIILIGSWGEKVTKEIYDLPKLACINAHPSLLPKYRGPNPYFWTIRNQEQSSGISFHLVDNGFDTGAILAQEEIKIYPSDTGKTLKERTVLTARGVVCELLKSLREDIIIPLTQVEEKSSYYSHPENLELDFTKSAEENSALIRAIYPWSEAYFFHNTNCFAVLPKGIEIEENKTDYTGCGKIVFKDENTKTLGILCSDNKILKIRVENYKKYDRPFTKFYIKRDISIGDLIL